MRSCRKGGWLFPERTAGCPQVGWKGLRSRCWNRRQTPPALFMALKEWWENLPISIPSARLIKLTRVCYSGSVAPAGEVNGRIWEGCAGAALEGAGWGTEGFSRVPGPAQTRGSPHQAQARTWAAHLWWNWTLLSPEDPELPHRPSTTGHSDFTFIHQVVVVRFQSVPTWVCRQHPVVNA